VKAPMYLERKGRRCGARWRSKAAEDQILRAGWSVAVPVINGRRMASHSSSSSSRASVNVRC